MKTTADSEEIHHRRPKALDHAGQWSRLPPLARRETGDPPMRDLERQT